jgi:hypothetical protein
MPRPSNEQCKAAIMQVIHLTPEGTLRPMSSNEMSRILRQEYGLSEKDSKKVSTQIRKSGPLHHDWKRAFVTQRFSQKNGRPPRDLLSTEDADEEVGEDQGAGSSSSPNVAAAAAAAAGATAAAAAAAGGGAAGAATRKRDSSGESGVAAPPNLAAVAAKKKKNDYCHQEKRSQPNGSFADFVPMSGGGIVLRDQGGMDTYHHPAMMEGSVSGVHHGGGPCGQPSPLPHHIDAQAHRQYMPHPFVPAMPMGPMACMPPGGGGNFHPSVLPPGHSHHMPHYGGGMIRVGPGLVAHLPMHPQQQPPPPPPPPPPLLLPSSWRDARLLIEAMDTAASNSPPLEVESSNDEETSSNFSSSGSDLTSTASLASESFSSSTSNSKSSTTKAASEIGSHKPGSSLSSAVASRDL